jgi:putative tricarboxylic transport membrane protein
MRSHKDIASGGVLFLVAAVYFMGTWKLPAGKGEPGPAFFPVLLACTLMFLAISILWQGLRTGQENKERSDHTPWKPIVAIAATALYVALFQVLGFALSTLLYTLSITWMFRRPRPAFIVAVPIVSTALIYILFRVGLGVRLPGGPFPWP